MTTTEKAEQAIAGEMNALRYHNGRAMQWEPVNRSGDDLVQDLGRGFQCFVQLEPGDGTRYDLLLTWPAARLEREAFHLSASEARYTMLVIRLRGGDVAGATLYGSMNYGAVKAIASGNEWTAAFLEWWLEELVRRVAARVIT